MSKEVEKSPLIVSSHDTPEMNAKIDKEMEPIKEMLEQAKDFKK